MRLILKCEGDPSLRFGMTGLLGINEGKKWRFIRNDSF